MFQVIDAETADEVWQRAAQWFLPGGLAVPQASRGGATTEVLHAALSIRDPRQRWIGSRVPAMNPAFAIAEVVWILSGRNDSAFLNFFNPVLPKFQGNGPTYHGAYGFRLRHQLGLDQLERAYRALSVQSNSRQVVLQIWDAREDLPRDDGSPQSPDIPCNVAALLKVREGKLEWTQLMRSNDLFRGLPHNIVQFTCLQEVFAGWLGLEPGTYNHVSDSLHLYANDGDVAGRVRPMSVPLNQDSLGLPKLESDTAFARLSAFGDLLAANDSKPADVIGSLGNLSLPVAHANFAAIMAADALRRKGAPEYAAEAAAKCSNECLSLLFSRWSERTERRYFLESQTPSQAHAIQD
jgi:thymidylate synthase